MFACLHSPHGDLFALASSFSSAVEQTSAGTVVFSIDGLGRLIGTPHQIGSEICRCGAAQGIHASLAIAQDPDTAVLIARNISGVTIVPRGKEADLLENLPIESITDDPELIETFDNWGVETLAQLAALPGIGLAARFGEEGLRLQNLALGRAHRTLRVTVPPAVFVRRVELENPVELIEPLLFVLSSMLHDLTEEMKRQSLAAGRIELALKLEDGSEHCRVLEFATPCRDPQTLLKLLQLDLEAHAPSAAIAAAQIELHPAPAAVLQHGLFLPNSPEPQKLQLVLSRLAGLVGEDNAGAAMLLDTHRPDAYVMRPFRPEPAREPQARASCFHLAFRVFRPALEAAVRLKQTRPAEVTAADVQGAVHTASGPWLSSGDWWAETQWAREEWDVELSDGGVYRIYCRLDSRCWFVAGIYD